MINALVAVLLVGIVALILFLIALITYWFADDLLGLQNPLKFMGTCLVAFVAACAVVITSAL